MHKPCMKYALCIVYVFENIKNTNLLRVHRKCALAGRLSKGHDKAMCLHFKQSGGCPLQSGNAHVCKCLEIYFRVFHEYIAYIYAFQVCIGSYWKKGCLGLCLFMCVSVCMSISDCFVSMSVCQSLCVSVCLVVYCLLYISGLCTALARKRTSSFPVCLYTIIPCQCAEGDTLCVPHCLATRQGEGELR